MTRIFFLTGIKHCGKSTIAKEIKLKLGYDVFDTDFILNRDNNFIGIRNLFKKLGEEKFRQKEYESIKNFLIEELPKKQNNNPIIIATGGGLADYPKTLSLLCNYGQIIYLKEKEKVLYERIIKNGIPPFLSSKDPQKTFHDLYNKRNQVYSSFSSFVLQLNGCSPTTAVERLVKLIEIGKEKCQTPSEQYLKSQLLENHTDLQ